MTIPVFIPNVWSARLLDKLDKTRVYVSFANRNYESELSRDGNMVTIPSGTSTVTVKDYQRETALDAPEFPTGSTQSLVVDQEKYIKFGVDDVEAKQSRPTAMSDLVDEAAKSVAEEQDTFMSGILNGAFNASREQTVPDATPVDNAGFGGAFFNALVELGQKMDDANIPTDGRWVIISSGVKAALSKYYGTSGGAGAASVFSPDITQATVRQGFSGTLAGFQLNMSSNIRDGAANTHQRLFAGQGRGAVTFVEQMRTMESLRDPDYVADIVRGVLVYGAKVVHPGRVFTIKAKKTT